MTARVRVYRIKPGPGATESRREHLARNPWVVEVCVPWRPYGIRLFATFAEAIRCADQLTRGAA